MRLLLIRHAEPNYEIDRLTENGKKEAEALAKLAPSLGLGTCYLSPLGRAQETASYSLQATGKQPAATFDWLQEFPASIDLNGQPELQKAYPGSKPDPATGRFAPRIVWDMVPSYLFSHPEYLDSKTWRDTLVARRSDMVPLYDHVVQSFDALLSEHGYVRDGLTYRVEKESTETLSFFCHFGVSCVLLSHLMNVSPFVLWHTLCLSTSSVSEIYTEERQKGIASFRALRLGDTTHLTLAGLQPSFAARFCEVFDSDDRHD